MTKSKTPPARAVELDATASKSTREPARRPAKTSALSRSKAADALPATPPSVLIDGKIASLGDWRGAVLGRLRALIKDADPDVVEEWKWSIPVWSDHGLICTGETYKKAVKMTFAHGASLADPACLFNSSLDGNVRRAIDVHEGEALDEAALKALVQAAVAFNKSRAGR